MKKIVRLQGQILLNTLPTLIGEHINIVLQSGAVLNGQIVALEQKKLIFSNFLKNKIVVEISDLVEIVYDKVIHHA